MRKLGLALLLLVLVVGTGWAAAWFYVAHEAGTQFDAWLKAEDAQGRSWTCPDRNMAGFPFSIALSCAKPTYTGHTADQTVVGEAAGLVAEAGISHPQRLLVSLQAPLTYRTSDGQAKVKASWSRLAVEIDGLPEAKITNLAGSDLVVEGIFADVGQAGGNAASLDATFTRADQDERAALDFTVAIHGSAIPSIDGLVGGQALVDAALAGRLDHADHARGATPEDAIEAWRQAGGRIQLSASRFSRDEAVVSGSGTLGLDAAHRLEGRVDASFVGLEPVLKRYGISGNLAAAGSILNALFGGGSHRQQAAPLVPGALNLPISFSNGRIGIGPIRTPIALPPLY